MLKFGELRNAKYSERISNNSNSLYYFTRHPCFVRRDLTNWPPRQRGLITGAPTGSGHCSIPTVTRTCQGILAESSRDRTLLFLTWEQLSYDRSGPIFSWHAHTTKPTWTKPNCWLVSRKLSRISRKHPRSDIYQELVFVPQRSAKKADQSQPLLWCTSRAQTPSTGSERGASTYVRARREKGGGSLKTDPSVMLRKLTWHYCHHAHPHRMHFSHAIIQPVFADEGLCLFSQNWAVHPTSVASDVPENVPL